VRDVLLPLRGSVQMTVLPMSFFFDSPLFKALGVSLGLHLALLGGGALSPVAPEPALAPLQVRLGPAEKMAGTLSVAATSKALLPHSPATSTPASAGDTSASPAAPAPASPAQSGAETSPEELTLPGGGATAAAVAPREGVSVDALRQYRVSLASAARRFKRYPPLARERGWEGTVEVALNVRAGRTLPEVVLMQSSGRELLDEQALAMVSQAARVTPLPEGLRGGGFRVLLPVRFSLESEP
jgi:protein TonB